MRPKDIAIAILFTLALIMIPVSSHLNGSSWYITVTMSLLSSVGIMSVWGGKL